MPAPAPVDPVVEGTGREVGEETGPPVELLIEGEVGLCTQVVDERGVFVVLPAPTAVEVDGPATRGYLAVWRDAVSEELFVYDRPLFDEFDVGQSVLNLRRDRDVPIETLTSASVLLEGRVAGAESIDEDATLWQPMTRQLLWRLMGYEWSPYEGEDESLGTVAIECPPERAFGEPGELDCEGLAATPQELSGRLVVVACSCIGRCCANPCLCNRCLCLNCDDRNWCTGDTCNGGTCYHIPLSCSDGIPCTTDSCNPATGCENTPDDAACDDGIYCNGRETCAAQGCQAGENPCPPELSCDEEHDACVECIGGGDCDDGDPCTEDSCWGWAFGEGGVAKGKCVSEPVNCGEGWFCCTGAGGCCPNGDDCCSGGCCATGRYCCPGGGCCPNGEDCCPGGGCCGQSCEGCYDDGFLSGGTITVDPPVACVGDTITFTLSGVVDSGGIKRVNCTAKTWIPPVTPTYTWTLILPPDYPPPLPPLTGTGSSATVTANLPGTYSCTFEAKAVRECDPPALDVGPETAKAVGVELRALGFDSDHALMLDNNTDFEPTGNPFTDPEWLPTATPPRNYPVSHTMDENVAVTLVVIVTPVDTPALTFDVVGASTVAGFNFSGSKSLHGGTNLPAFTSTDKIERRIQKITPSIQWTFTNSGMGCQQQTTTGPHTVYVTMNTPSDTNQLNYVVTQKRMERTLQQASTANSLNPHEIVKTVVQAQPFNLNSAPSNPWTVPTDTGDCQSIVRFAEMVAKQVGCPGTFATTKIYATNTAPTIGIDDGPNGGGLNTHTIWHPNGDWIINLISGGASPGCNAFESAAKFTYCQETRFYPAGTSHVYSSKDEVLYVFDKMSWVVNADLPGTCTPVDPPVFEYTPKPAESSVPNCP